jgi:hypothetical protein
VIELPEGNWWDWDVVAWDPGRFVLGADFDLTYHHNLELVFSDPVYVQCPAFFQHPVFREPTPGERSLVRLMVQEPEPVVVAFDAEVGAGEVSGLIAAGGVQVVAGTVLRYRTSGS